MSSKKMFRRVSSGSGTYNSHFTSKLVLDFARLDRSGGMFADQLVEVFDTHFGEGTDDKWRWRLRGRVGERGGEKKKVRRGAGESVIGVTFAFLQARAIAGSRLHLPCPERMPSLKSLGGALSLSSEISTMPSLSPSPVHSIIMSFSDLLC
jgi:hypothetical protein